MLRRIPSINPNGMKSFFVSIDSKLSIFENLKDTPALLELTIWKTKIFKQFLDQNNRLLTIGMLKIQWCTESVTRVNIIVPNVTSFLTDGDDSNCVVSWSNEDDDDDDYQDDEDDDDEDNKSYEECYRTSSNSYV
jgi:hypothetical protein